MCYTVRDDEATLCGAEKGQVMTGDDFEKAEFLLGPELLDVVVSGSGEKSGSHWRDKVETVCAVFDILTPVETVSVIKLWFVGECTELEGGMSPLEAVRAGLRGEVLTAAHAFAETG